MKESKFHLGHFFKKYYKYIFLLLGIVGIAIMIIQCDPATIPWEDFLKVELVYVLLACLGIWVIIYILHTFSYKIILGDESKKIDFPHLLKVCVTGFALNNVTPAGLVGGEPYRIMELKKYCSTEKSTSATLTFTLSYVLGHLMIWVAGVAVCCIVGLPGSTIIDVFLIASGVICLAAVFCIIFVRIKLVYPIMKLLTKLPFIGKKLAPIVERKKESYIEIDSSIMDFRNSGWRFYAVMIIQFATRVLESFEYFIIMQYVMTFFGNNALPITFIDGLLVMTVSSLLGNILFIIPMQAGSREGGMAMALNFICKSDRELLKSIALPIGLVYRFRELICTMTGIIMVAATRLNKKAIAEVESSIQDNSENTEEADSK